MIKKDAFLFLSIMVVFCVSCESIIPEAPPENELLDGPMEGLSHAEQGQFLDGDIAFNDDVFFAENGLGPKSGDTLGCVCPDRVSVVEGGPFPSPA
jgi:hypothetical protein